MSRTLEGLVEKVTVIFMLLSVISEREKYLLAIIAIYIIFKTSIHMSQFDTVTLNSIFNAALLMCIAAYISIINLSIDITSYLLIMVSAVAYVCMLNVVTNTYETWFILALAFVITAMTYNNYIYAEAKDYLIKTHGEAYMNSLSEYDQKLVSTRFPSIDDLKNSIEKDLDAKENIYKLTNSIKDDLDLANNLLEADTGYKKIQQMKDLAFMITGMNSMDALSNYDVNTYLVGVNKK